MKMYWIAPFLLAAGLVLGAGSLIGQVPTPSQGIEDELIAKNLEARGGLEKLKAVNTMMMTGTIDMEMGGQEMSMAVTIYKKRPDKMRSEVTIPSMGVEVINGFDGEVAWMDNPMAGGVQKMPEAQARLAHNQANMDGVFVDYKETGVKVEYAGEAEVRGRAAQKLKVTRPDSTETFVYLDAETHLESKLEGKGVNPQTGTEVVSETFLTDYREVGGMMVPFSMEVNAGGFKQVITFTDIQINAGADDALFAFPGGQ